MSVHKTKSGTWRVKWRDEWGQQFSKNFRLKGDADRMDREIKDGRRPRNERPRLTFAEFSERWLKNHATVHQEYSTRINSESVIQNYLIPRFGEKLLPDLEMTDFVELQRFVRVDKGRSPKTTNNIMVLVKKMLTDAVNWGLIDENPALKVKPLKFQKKEQKFWSHSEKDRFLAFVKSRDFELYRCVLISLDTGMRRGELKELRRDALDFDRNQILIRRSFCEYAKKAKEYTKSKEIRWVPMTKLVKEALSDKRLLSPEQKVLGYDLMSMVRKRFRRMCKRAGVTEIRWHDLRHTFASHLVMGGAPPLSVQKLLGHSSDETTQGYSHLSPGFYGEVIHILENSHVPLKFPQQVNER